ncbi:MAG: hypothetical protein JEZ14_08975 [Marinilabiliaceae bacterium]|nr:hypothetical protein [Marinilabiliaceae bacterium]
MQTSEIYKQIVRPDNIYKAIYAMESFVFEKELLSDKSGIYTDKYLRHYSDISLYAALRDKYNDILIDHVIAACISKINQLTKITNNLFKCNIYFKAKKYDEGKVEFRPIHTSNLLDQICMVAMLMPIMFDDSSKKRELSPISRLLPANFYGNMPSTNMAELFKPWNKQYKEYSTKAIEAGAEYKKNNKYKYEVNLDLKRFYPSIDPLFVHNYILSKWPVGTSNKDMKCIDWILSKLLYLDITGLPTSLRGLYNETKVSKNNKGKFHNVGVPQGLPQAYFFGNICMTLIARETNKLIEGDAYYYVDDSVIYTNVEKDNGVFKKLHDNIRQEMHSIIDNGPHKVSKDQNNVYYDIQFYDFNDDKSSHFEINPVNINSLFFLAKPASPLNFEISTASDEYDDVSLLSKCIAILDVIDRLVTISENETQKKLLKRFKKFYTNRKNYLIAVQANDIGYDKDKIDEFINRHGLNDEPSNSDFFDRLKDDVFQFEGKLIAQQIADFSNEKNDDLLHVVKAFEFKCLGSTADFNRQNIDDYFYYSKFLKHYAEGKDIQINQYQSLESHQLLRVIKDNQRLTYSDKFDRIKELTRSTNSLYGN